MGFLNHAAPKNTSFSSPDTSAAESYSREVDSPTLKEVGTAYYGTTEPLERMELQRKFKKRALTTWAHD